MSLLLLELLTIAQFHRATVYGYGEYYCGIDPNPRPCIKGEMTASGEEFDPELPTAAIPAPYRVRMRPFNVRVRNHMGECVSIRVNDKSNPRWVGQRGLDLTPAAVKLITGAHSKSWSGKLTFCREPIYDVQPPKGV